MNLRQFKRAYRKLVSSDWHTIPNWACIRLSRKANSLACHCPVTAVASATAKFRLRGRLGTKTTYRAGKKIGLTERNVLFIMRCADLNLKELKKFGKRAIKLRHFLLNPTS